MNVVLLVAGLLDYAVGYAYVGLCDTVVVIGGVSEWTGSVRYRVACC